MREGFITHIQSTSEMVRGSSQQMNQKHNCSANAYFLILRISITSSTLYLPPK